jgi:hypothetical protein
MLENFVKISKLILFPKIFIKIFILGGTPWLRVEIVKLSEFN